MKKTLLALFALIMLSGCSMMNNNKGTPTPTATPTATPSAMPTESPTAARTQDYLDYIGQKYNLTNAASINDLDTNLMEGYTFTMNNSTYYLLQYDPTNATANNWFSNLNDKGQIEVEIAGLPKNMYAIVNGNYVLLSDTNKYMEGFTDYYSGYNGMNNTMPTVSPTATPKA